MLISNSTSKDDGCRKIAAAHVILKGDAKITKDQDSRATIKRRLNKQVLPKIDMDKDPGENYLPKQVTIKSAAMKKKWRHFIDNSTLHGMQYVFNGETKIRTIIWTVVLLAGTAYFTYQSSVLLKRYYSYPITTKITLKYEEVAEFPAITICHFNKLRKTFVDKHNAEEVLKYALTGALGTKINSSTIGWTGLRNFSMEDILKIGGHQIEKMMKTCLWRGKKCDERNFTKILTPMGLCHTFNSGKFV